MRKCRYKLVLTNYLLINKTTLTINTNTVGYVPVFFELPLRPVIRVEIT